MRVQSAGALLRVVAGVRYFGDSAFEFDKIPRQPGSLMIESAHTEVTIMQPVMERRK